MGCYNLPNGGCCRLTRGCVPGNSYNIVSFNLGNNHRLSVGFVSSLGLTTVIARMTSTHAYILRPTDRARHRLASRRLVRTNIHPSLVHLSIKVRGTSSVVTSVRRTLGTWLFLFLSFSASYFIPSQRGKVFLFLLLSLFAASSLSLSSLCGRSHLDTIILKSRNIIAGGGVISL